MLLTNPPPSVPQFLSSAQQWFTMQDMRNGHAWYGANIKSVAVYGITFISDDEDYGCCLIYVSVTAYKFIGLQIALSFGSCGRAEKITVVALVNLQIDPQNFYLFIYSYNTFIKILYMFRALPCSSSGGLRRNCILAAYGIVTLCRWLSCAPVKKEQQFFLNRCTRQSPTESDDTRDCIYIQLRRRPPEDEQGNARNM